MTIEAGRKSTKPIQARAEETRCKVLLQARKAFAEKGFDGANTRDISSAAGVAHTAIRYHFGTKDQLWRAVIEKMFQELEAEVYPPLEKLTDGTEILRQFIHNYIAYCARNPEHARIMIAETARGGDRLIWVVEEYTRKRHLRAAETIKAAVENGILPDVPVISLIYCISAMCQLPFVLAKEAEALYGHDLSDNAHIKAHTDAVLKILLRDDGLNTAAQAKDDT